MSEQRRFRIGPMPLVHIMSVGGNIVLGTRCGEIVDAEWAAETADAPTCMGCIVGQDEVDAETRRRG